MEFLDYLLIGLAVFFGLVGYTFFACLIVSSKRRENAHTKMVFNETMSKAITTN